jgi:ketosteroid isomerase-like protein
LGDSGSPPTEGDLTTNKEIIEGAYASFARGDVPAALGAMADDIRWVEADGFPLSGTYVGPQNVLEGVFMRLGEIGDNFAVVPDQFVADGDTVVALGTYTWKRKGTGDPAAVKMAHVWTMGDGKAVAFQQHVDTIRVRELS